MVLERELKGGTRARSDTGAKPQLQEGRGSWGVASAWVMFTTYAQFLHGTEYERFCGGREFCGNSVSSLGTLVSPFITVLAGAHCIFPSSCRIAGNLHSLFPQLSLQTRSSILAAVTILHNPTPTSAFAGSSCCSLHDIGGNRSHTTLGSFRHRL